MKWENVKVGLKPSEVAVEFIAFKVNFPQKTDSTMYAALFLEYGSKQPRIIPLFEERQLTQLLTNNKESNLITSLYASRGVVPIKSIAWWLVRFDLEANGKHS
ncbi:MAG: hypothetical protein IPI30_16805 [Saprospiraceae bacterium]|nr:hypothetical protein [Candidatus Vicinibacter affinis]